MIGERNILCIDWDERSLRVLDGQIRRTGLRVRHAVHVPLPEELSARDPVEMGEFLRKTLAEHRIRTRRAIVDVPRQDAVFTLMPLPHGTMEEMASMVQVQAAKELPFARDQAVVDFAVAGAAKEGMSEVWMAAVRTAVVDWYQQVAAGAGLRLERIGLRPYANLAALGGSYPAEGRTLMVDIGPAMTEINVVVDGRLAYSRAASVSIPPEGLHAAAPKAAAETRESEGTIPLLDDSAPRPGPMEALLIEVSRTIEAYRATSPGAAINRVVLAGAVPLDARVIERFERRFGAPAQIYEAPAAIAWRRSGEMTTAAFSAVVGLALTGTGEGIAYFDFLHPKEPEAAGRGRKRQRPILVATIAVFVATAGMLAYQPIRSRKVQIESLSRRISEANQDAKARKELLDQLADAQDWQTKNIIWIDRVKQLAEVFPSNQEGYVTRLECSEKGTISAEMLTKDVTVVTRIVDGVAELKGPDGQSLYRAHPGKMEESRLGDYPVRDRVVIEMEGVGGGS